MRIGEHWPPGETPQIQVGVSEFGPLSCKILMKKEFAGWHLVILRDLTSSFVKSSPGFFGVLGVTQVVPR